MGAAPIQLVLLHAFRDAEGEPMTGLLLPPQTGSASTRPIVQVYESVGAALQAKRMLEAADARS